MDDSQAKKVRKEEAKKLKRERIEAGGGVRPRPEQSGNDAKKPKRDEKSKHDNKERREKSKQRTRPTQIRSSRVVGPAGTGSGGSGQHRFGRVMERVPCPGKPRYSTLSIAIPGSVMSNCQTRELRTQMVGQIARAATIYHVDEIIVFDDKLATDMKDHHRGFRRNPNPTTTHVPRNNHNNQDSEERKDDKQQEPPKEAKPDQYAKSDPHTFMARVLQYCECPQYLRRHFFPMHPDLQFAGLLSPIDAPHHVREGEPSPFREGVVFEKIGPNGGSLVNCGIRGRPVEIDRVLTAGIRCTVEIDEKAYSSPGRAMKGKVVSPAAPREKDGTYWGYTTRLADSINAVLEECPFGSYDLKIGTSERGDVTVDDGNFNLPTYRHSLVVFGGVAGIEECVDADESLTIPGSESRTLFDMWVNTCPFQASRTIRTEEAVLLSLARLRPYIAKNNESKAGDVSLKNKNGQTELEDTPTLESIDFNDDVSSEESSDDDDDK